MFRVRHAILDGDKAHRDWLLKAAEGFIAGKKPPNKAKLPGSDRG